MKNDHIRLLYLLALPSLILAQCTKSIPENQQIHEGNPIPVMQFQADTGETIKSTSFQNQWTILYFYPKDDSPGCTTQAKTFSSLMFQYRAANAMIYGINTDSLESHRAFKKKHNLAVTLLTDPEGTTALRFGIRIVAGMCARDSVLINPTGKVEKIYRGVDPAGNPVEILDYIERKTSS